MVKKRNEAGARGLSPEGSAAEAKRMRRQTAKDDRARRRRTSGTPSRAQGVRQRAGGAFPRRRRRSPKGLPFFCDKRSPGRVGRGRAPPVAASWRSAPRPAPPLPPPPPPQRGDQRPGGSRSDQPEHGDLGGEPFEKVRAGRYVLLVFRHLQRSPLPLPLHGASGPDMA